VFDVEVVVAVTVATVTVVHVPQSAGQSSWKLSVRLTSVVLLHFASKNSFTVANDLGRSASDGTWHNSRYASGMPLQVGTVVVVVAVVTV
jgi:hypothetical protein